MLLTLLNIIIPVFAVAGAGYWFARRLPQGGDMGFLTSSPTLAFGHRLRGKEGDSYGATHEKPRA